MQNAQVLIQAAGRGELKTIEYLLTDGADVNAANDHGETALIRAASHGQAETINLLLERGADPNAKSAEGMTALIRAALCGHAEVARLLLSRGAERAAKDRFGSTALDWALAKGHEEIAALLTGNAAQIEQSRVNRVTTPLDALAPHASSPFAYSTQTRMADADDLPTPRPPAMPSPIPAEVKPTRAVLPRSQAETPEVFTRQQPARRSAWTVALSVIIFLLVSGAVVAALVFNRQGPTVDEAASPALNTSLVPPVQLPTPLPTAPPAQPETPTQISPADEEGSAPSPAIIQPTTTTVLTAKPAPSVLAEISTEKLRGRNILPPAPTPVKRRRTTAGTDAVLLDGNGEPVEARETPSPTLAPTPRQRVVPTRDTEAYRPAPIATAPPTANLPDSRKKKVIQWP
jgi:hypothetical protein